MILFDEEYLQTQLFSVSVWFMQESFLQDEVSVKMGPKIKKQRNSIMLAKQDEKCTNRGNYTVDWGKAVRKHQSTSRFVNSLMQFYKFTLTVSFDPLVFNLVLWAFPLKKRKKQKWEGREKAPLLRPSHFFWKKPWGRGWLVLLKRKI